MKPNLNTLWVALLIYAGYAGLPFASAVTPDFGPYKTGACLPIWDACKIAKTKFWSCFKELIDHGKYPGVDGITKKQINACREQLPSDESGGVALPGGHSSAVPPHATEKQGPSAGTPRGGKKTGTGIAPPPGSGRMGEENQPSDQLPPPAPRGEKQEGAPEEVQKKGGLDQNRGAVPPPPPGLGGGSTGGTPGGQGLPPAPPRGQKAPGTPEDRLQQEPGDEGRSSLPPPPSPGGRQSVSPPAPPSRSDEFGSDSEPVNKNGTGENRDFAPKYCATGNCYPAMSSRFEKIREGMYAVYDKNTGEFKGYSGADKSTQAK